MAGSAWDLVADERRALAADLEHLTEQQWRTPSLCDAWTVHQVLGHQVATALMTPPKFFVKLAGSGFSFTRMSDKNVAAHTQAVPADTLASYRAVETSTKHPPGPFDSWLGEALIHSEDIRRPLGIRRDYPVGSVTRVLDFYKGSNLIVGAKKRVEGVQLKATDTDWSHGEGPVAEGRAIDLLMAMVGRKAALDDLVGPGVEVLRGR